MLKLNQTPLQYAKASLLKKKIQLKTYNYIYAFLNLIILLIVAAISILTALMVSKLIYPSFPNWFFMVSTGLGAGSLMLTSFINFFTVDKKIKKANKNIVEIQAEIWKYNHKATKPYQMATKNITLYRRIAAIDGNISAESEVSHE